MAHTSTLAQANKHNHKHKGGQGKGCSRNEKYCPDALIFQKGSRSSKENESWKSKRNGIAEPTICAASTATCDRCGVTQNHASGFRVQAFQLVDKKTSSKHLENPEGEKLEKVVPGLIETVILAHLDDAVEQPACQVRAPRRRKEIVAASHKTAQTSEGHSCVALRIGTTDGLGIAWTLPRGAQQHHIGSIDSRHVHSPSRVTATIAITTLRYSQLELVYRDVCVVRIYGTMSYGLRLESEPPAKHSNHLRA